MKIYSNIDPTLLLHGVYSKAELSTQPESRVDFSSEVNGLQISSIRSTHTKSFKPHFHLNKSIKEHISKAEEAWVVIKGSVLVNYFDTDNSMLKEVVLNPGDVSYTFDGGHGYKILENETLIYEFKSGPYLGPELDKKYI
jgi:hypothetical protein